MEDEVSREGLYRLAAAVVRGTIDPAEKEKWRQWALARGARDGAGPPHAAQQARRPGHMVYSIFEHKGRDK